MSEVTFNKNQFQELLDAIKKSNQDELKGVTNKLSDISNSVNSIKDVVTDLSKYIKDTFHKDLSSGLQAIIGISVLPLLTKRGGLSGFFSTVSKPLSGFFEILRSVIQTVSLVGIQLILLTTIVTGLTFAFLSLGPTVLVFGAILASSVASILIITKTFTKLSKRLSIIFADTKKITEITKQLISTFNAITGTFSAITKSIFAITALLAGAYFFASSFLIAVTYATAGFAIFAAGILTVIGVVTLFIKGLQLIPNLIKRAFGEKPETIASFTKSLKQVAEIIKPLTEALSSLNKVILIFLGLSFILSTIPQLFASGFLLLIGGITAISLSLVIFGKTVAKYITTDVIKNLKSFSLITALFVAGLYGFSKLDFSGVIKNATIASGIVLLISGLIYLVDKLKITTKTILNSILIGTVIFGIISLMQTLANLPTLEWGKVFKNLSIAGTAIIAIGAFASILGLVSETVIPLMGLGLLTLGVFGLVLGALYGISKLLELTVKSISKTFKIIKNTQIDQEKITGFVKGVIKLMFGLSSIGLFAVPALLGVTALYGVSLLLDKTIKILTPLKDSFAETVGVFVGGIKEILSIGVINSLKFALIMGSILLSFSALGLLSPLLLIGAKTLCIIGQSLVSFVGLIEPIFSILEKTINSVANFFSNISGILNSASAMVNGVGNLVIVFLNTFKDTITQLSGISADSLLTASIGINTLGNALFDFGTKISGGSVLNAIGSVFYGDNSIIGQILKLSAEAPKITNLGNILGLLSTNLQKLAGITIQSTDLGITKLFEDLKKIDTTGITNLQKLTDMTKPMDALAMSIDKVSYALEKVNSVGMDNLEKKLEIVNRLSQQQIDTKLNFETPIKEKETPNIIINSPVNNIASTNSSGGGSHIINTTTNDYVERTIDKIIKSNFGC